MSRETNAPWTHQPGGQRRGDQRGGRESVRLEIILRARNRWKAAENEKLDWPRFCIEPVSTPVRSRDAGRLQ